MADSRVGQLVARECGCESAASDCSCVVVASSIPSVVLALVGPPLLVVLSLFWLRAGAPWPVGILAAAGLAGSAVVLFDLPVLSTFDASGVTRRTPLRDHHIGWPDIQQLALTGGFGPSNLVARVGERRRYLLADRVALHADELDMLSRMRPS